MPCNSSYLEPSGREAELQRAAKLLEYVMKDVKIPVPAWVSSQARDIYAQDDRAVTELCSLLRAMTDAKRESLVYNAHSKTARDLADWWEEHQRADVVRERHEAAERRREELKAQAQAKLTRDEKRALGLTV